MPPGAEPGDHRDAIAAAEDLAVGDRVSVIAGKEHMPEHEGVAGTVKIVDGDSIGVLFDGTKAVHKWYAPDELTTEDPAA